MIWWMKIIRFLFLVKEIVSKEGEVHFRRYRLLALPWLRIYIHQILISDYDAHFHDHPWHFISYILKGSYHEKCTEYPNHIFEFSSVYSSEPAMSGLKPRRIIKHHAQDTHQITILTPEVWTCVITWGRPRYWGYRLQGGEWVGHKEYRQLKNEGKLR